MPFFSMIVPCYNTGFKIGRLLDSLLKQNISKEDLQLIIVDDNSTDKSYLDIVESYRDKLNIELTETDLGEDGIHCPGNTRNVGMKYVTGEWLCFCDHDDFYEDNALSRIKQFIDETGERYCVCSILRSWNPDTDKYTDFYRKTAWLHGKFYNMNNLIKPYHIQFYPNLKTHEDLYFNGCVINVMFSLNRDYAYLDEYTYRWVENKRSITRGYESPRGYLHDNFKDYIICASEPFYKNAVDTGDWCYVNQVIMTLLHCYFYIQGCLFRFGIETVKDNYEDTLELYNRIKSDLKMDIPKIIEFVFSDPDKYMKVRSDCCIHEGAFIENNSFIEFLYILEGMNKKEENPQPGPKIGRIDPNSELMKSIIEKEKSNEELKDNGEEIDE